MVEGEGFEPSKAEPSDLQSDPFGRSGIPPDCWYRGRIATWHVSGAHFMGSIPRHATLEVLFF